jgi:hypothetical protein
MISASFLVIITIETGTIFDILFKQIFAEVFSDLPQTVFVYNIVHLPAMVASSNNYCKEACRILLSYVYFFP